MKHKVSAGFIFLIIMFIAVVIANRFNARYNATPQTDESLSLSDEHSDGEFCKNVYQYFGAGTVVEAYDAINRGDYYEMTATIDEALTEGPYEGASVKDIIIRVRKDATVYWIHDRDTKLTLSEYANHTDKDEALPFTHARMLETTHDENGYITAFVDGQAG